MYFFHCNTSHIYSWYGGDSALFAHKDQKHRNGRNYNKKAIWKLSNKKTITRFRRWDDAKFLQCIWNVRYFSPIGQSLSNKNEATHAFWTFKFYRYFNSQINYTDWPMVQIILLGNKNLSRCNTLIKDENNPLYSSLDFIWIKRMKHCLQRMVDIDDLKALRSVSGCFVLDFAEQKLNEESFLNFNPNQCHKYVQYIKSVDEEKILFVIGQFLLNQKIQRQTKKNKQSSNKNNNINNNNNDDDDDDDEEEEHNDDDDLQHLNIPMVINKNLVQQIKKTVGFNYNDNLIINLLKRTFYTIDELDGSAEEDGDSTEAELDNDFDA